MTNTNDMLERGAGKSTCLQLCRKHIQDLHLKRCLNHLNGVRVSGLTDTETVILFHISTRNVANNTSFNPPQM